MIASIPAWGIRKFNSAQCQWPQGQEQCQSYLNYCYRCRTLAAGKSLGISSWAEKQPSGYEWGEGESGLQRSPSVSSWAFQRLFSAQFLITCQQELCSTPGLHNPSLKELSHPLSGQKTQPVLKIPECTIPFITTSKVCPGCKV